MADIEAALAPLVDVDGEFIVADAGTAGVAHIEFAGSMAGTPQDLIEIVVFDAPAGDPWIALKLESAALTEAFAAANTNALTLPLEIVVTLQQGTDPVVERDYVVYCGDVVLQERVTHDDLATVVDTDYVRSPYGRDYRPFNASQMTTGNKAFRYVFGDGSEAVFAPVHNLHSDDVGVIVRENHSGGAELAPKIDYTVAFDGEDNATITLLGDYAATPPATNALLAHFIDYNQTSAHDVHTHEMGQIIGLLTTLVAKETTVPGITRPLRPVWRVLRSRTLPPVPSSLASFNLAGSGLRESRLLPAVHDAATEALPTPLPEPSNSHQGRVFLAGSAVEDFPGAPLRVGDLAACDGREWYQVRKETTAQSSYYPVPFEVELFREIISEAEFTAKSVCTIAFGFETMMLPPARNLRDRETVAAHWELIVEFGTIVREAVPGTPGSNLTMITWAAPVIATRIELASVPKAARFAVEITKAANGTLTAKRTIYRATDSCTAPGAATFAVRARLGRFDIGDLAPDPRGLILLRGLDVGLDGQTDHGLGRVRIG